MCRFLLIRSVNKVKPDDYLTQFSKMCEKSRTPDGDRQTDGWGITWKENGSWKVRKSLLPIWKDIKLFSNIPSTNLFMAHARSAGFRKDKGNISYNQPYITDSLAFVFNGMVRGVRIPFKLEGEIGAQKIFSLLKKELIFSTPVKSLQTVKKFMKKHSQIIEGMNIGLVKDDRLYALCEYASNKDYFSIRYFKNDYLTIVCSEAVGLYNWQIMKKGEIIAL